eukprot:568858-Prorocentrum_lima.AAC.1
MPATEAPTGATAATAPAPAPATEAPTGATAIPAPPAHHRASLRNNRPPRNGLGAATLRDEERWLQALSGDLG